ncbi:co-chaperone GroES [Chitinivibrio alkaliphilus]|uniref:Chaperonin Cpn10 n=1 Tax=Chitinivibrio alkaliphilus ACht1 TaxID=1313304 RepID=U7DC85_9BACT|nr:co-chaperone GroES family protein [Chitinivibrio alkaliphilus]ERP39188.1 chaperonin Cpn10 [Chitinivibrio alkaliphilus ACht1]
MTHAEKEILVIGDRLLIAPARDGEKTSGGLYLPQSVEKKNAVKSGIVVQTGPGYLIPASLEQDEWHEHEDAPRYIPLQVQKGDFVLFLKKQAIEIEYDEKTYMIVQQSDILTIIRDKILGSL